MLNDQAIGAMHLLRTRKAKQILIVDLDVHQGNGTAEIFADNDSVFTFSMHGAANYPFRKEKSDLDIPLDKNTDDETYLSILKETLPKLIDRVKPDFIFYLNYRQTRKARDDHRRLQRKRSICSANMLRSQHPRSMQYGRRVLSRHKNHHQRTCQHFSLGTGNIFLGRKSYGRKVIMS